MGKEIVTLIVGGIAYTAWKSMSVKYSAQSAEREFEVQAADEAPDLISNAWLFEPGTECELHSNGSLLVKGYINDLKINIASTAHDLRVSGRSAGQDVHDCSVKHKTKEWKNKTLLEIGNDTGSNVKFTSKEKLTPIPVVRANPGEKIFPFMDRHANNKGLFIHGKADGTVEITKHGKERHAGALVEGLNILEGSAEFSDRERHADYKVNGQQANGTGENAIHGKGEATDEGARPGRYLERMQDTNSNSQTAKERAEHMKRTRQGLSVKAEITTQGFRDEGGEIWETGKLVFCQSIMLHLSQDLCIESVTLSQDEGGSKSVLNLVDPSALGGETAGGGKMSSGKIWTKGTK